MMELNILVTGGAGFIGRWVVDHILNDGHQVWVLDDLSNGRIENMIDLKKKSNFMGFIEGNIKDNLILNDLFAKSDLDICFHLAAKINVQDSIDKPRTTFENDVMGTFNILELCKKHHVKMVFISTCMVYDRDRLKNEINETNAIKPPSIYAGSKLAAENMVLSYYHTYNLPITVIRPFNTYWTLQKTSAEGGVVAIFIKNKLANIPVQIYGDGTQTRELLYVEDCARFVVESGYSEKENGEIGNAGTGKENNRSNRAK